MAERLSTIVLKARASCPHLERPLDHGALSEIAAGDSLGRLGDRGERARRQGAEAEHHEPTGQEHREAHQPGGAAGVADGAFELLQRQAEVERAQRRPAVALDPEATR